MGTYGESIEKRRKSSVFPSLEADSRWPILRTRSTKRERSSDSPRPRSHNMVNGRLSLPSVRFPFGLCSEIKTLILWISFGAVTPKRKSQTACKPGSVLALQRGTTIHLGRLSPVASRDRPGRHAGNALDAAPIWSCSRWGLPCRRRYRRRGALLPHPFTLTRRRRSSFAGRFAFCGTFPGVAPARRYLAPCFRGARTFLTA